MIPYVLHVSLLLAVCLLFYKLLLQKETYYRLNRLVLIVCLASAFLLPLIQVPQQWALRESPQPAVLVSNPLAVPQYSQMQAPEVVNLQPPAARVPVVSVPQVPPVQRIMKWLLYLYWFGVAAFAANLLLQVCALLFQAYRKPVIIDGIFRIVELGDDKAPCSFGNSIFINPAKYDLETYNQILLHEKIHIKQGHSFDLLFAELVLAFQWFNPFAWLYRKEVESNLEYLADSEVLHDASVERAAYQMNLLKVSVPNLSLRITTNYNQSLLKKRIMMMNAKRSNIHTAWKYLFLLPMMAFLVCALNQPKAMSQTTDSTEYAKAWEGGNRNEGNWKATIKGSKIEMDISSYDNHSNMSMGENYPLADLTALPKGKTGDFKMTREAGTMFFNGRFDGDKGKGTYKFTGDPKFITYLKSEGIGNIDKYDPVAFFVINLNKAYIDMIHRNGYKNVSKSDMIAMCALKVDEGYIRSLKQNGYPSITAQQLITGKAMGIDGAYIAEIRKAGNPKIDFDKLVSYKAQGINGDYIAKFKSARGATAIRSKGSKKSRNDDNEDDMIAYKSLGVDDAYVSSMKKAGFNGLSSADLISMKALGITAEFVQSFKNAGYTNISHDEIISLKALNITPEYLNSFRDAGYKNINIDKANGLKALGVTPEFIKSFKSVGFNSLTLDDATSLKAMGITPDYITQMREKGFKSDDINKYITLKSAF